MSRIEELEEEVNHLRSLIRRLHQDLAQQNLYLATIVQTMEAKK